MCLLFMKNTTRTSDLKNAVLLLIDLQSNRPKRTQSAANDVEGVEYYQLHHV